MFREFLIRNSMGFRKGNRIDEPNQVKQIDGGWLHTIFLYISCSSRTSEIV